MVEKVWEKFSWFRDDIRNSAPLGNKINIRGKALCATISRNNRHYIEDELIKSARTLAGKPIDVNHAISVWTSLSERGETTAPKPKEVGNVIDAEYEDGFIEYVAQINDREYVAKLKDREYLSKEDYIAKWGKEPIYGVSVDAVYRYPQNETEKDDPTIPIGIQFIRLSLVEDPEKPGVINTTIELMEKSLTETTIIGNLIKDYAPDIFETYQSEVVSKMSEATTEKDKPKFAVSDNTPVTYDPRGEYALSRGDIPTSEYTFGKSEKETEKILQERFGLTEEQLGEPHAGYDDFDACVAANSDKDDPAAYCAEIWKTHEIKETESMVIPKVEKVEFKSLTKEPPKQAPKKEKVEETVEDKEIILPEVKTLESKKGTDMSLREKQEVELRRLEEKQFRDRNEAEHEEFRKIGEQLGDKINEVIDVRGKEAEVLRNWVSGEITGAIKSVSGKLQESIDTLDEQNKTLKDKNDELVEASNTQKAIIESYKEKFDSIEVENKTLKERNDEFIEASNTQKTIMESYEEKFASLEAENTSLKEENIKLGTTVEENKVTIGSLSTRVDEIGEFKVSFEETKADLLTRIEALEEFKQAYDTYKEGTQAVIDSLTEKIEEMNKEPEEDPVKKEIETLKETFETQIEDLKTHIKPEFKSPEHLEEDETSKPSISLEVDPTIG
jgi:hypothetical protein